jgi:L-2-hydroxyglutarate oxidase
MSAYDCVIVGGGIVGLAVGFAYLKRVPGSRIAILEKEDRIAAHQTGRNSGVIHSGIYYAPGSAKAELCRKGAAEMISFCQEHGIPVKVTGKIIVATTERELPGLATLADRAKANGVPVREIGREEALEIEPHVNAIRALHVPTTAVVDFRQVCQKLLELIQSAGGSILLNRCVESIGSSASELHIRTSGDVLSAAHLINCAGLQSDRVARLQLNSLPVRIIPFRGDYFELSEKAERLVKALVYPVPNPSFPFLGVHLTRGIDDTVHAGPSAVPALARENYGKLGLNAGDAAEILLFPGTWHLAARFWNTGISEILRALSKRRFLDAVQRLVPAIRIEDLQPADSGIRAQAVRFDGSMVDDFLILEGERSTHVLNAPSPAATASLAIGQRIVDRLPKPTQRVFGSGI